MNNEIPIIKKRIIHRYTKPLLIFVKKEDPYELRTKSAPPLNIVEDNKEPKKFILCRADGTPITLYDLSDVSDSSEEEVQTKDTKTEQRNLEKIKEDENNLEQTKDNKNKIKENTLKKKKIENATDKYEKAEIISKPICPSCEINVSKRENILKNLLEMYKIEEDKLATTPYIFVPKIILTPQIRYSIEEIMNCQESKPFTLKLLVRNTIKIPVNFKEFKVNKETVIEKATFELNKLTSSNLKKIVSNLRQLNLETIQQAKYLGNLIVFKSVNEPQYCYQYAMVVGLLKKDFKSKEEIGLSRKQTAFFGTVLTSTMKILEDKIQWADGIVLERNAYKNGFEYERAFEEQETERYSKKKKTLGAVDFLCHLYNLDIITLKHIKDRLDEFLKIENEEVIEVLGRFIDKIGEKLCLNEKIDYVNMICGYLNKCKDKYLTRVKFYIMDVLDRKKKWKKPDHKTGNIFALLEIEEEEEAKSSIKAEALIEDIKFDADIAGIVGNIYEDLGDADGEEDEIAITDNFKIACDNYGKIPFFSTYFLECITNTRRNKSLLSFLIHYFNETGLFKEDVYDILKEHKGNLNEYKIDSPFSVRNYKELIIQLKESKIINENAYDKLQISG